MLNTQAKTNKLQVQDLNHQIDQLSVENARLKQELSEIEDEHDLLRRHR